MLTVLSIASMTLGDGDGWPPSAVASAASDGPEPGVNRQLSGMVWALGDAPIAPASCRAAMQRATQQCSGNHSCLARADQRLALCEASGLWRE
ncbi:hypothetical protein NYR55_13995 [Sphingomonas sp. BGYR3]|uniref:hypothetical protein n=1 Tax=Sphingomonas sp. BGYR3 TaxID=2975483 RepID=UPI0021A30907|nr:hypothetical protein [Sphingomonas sp. BGYR3]MDG5489731.1 hypothetical protein [Sphingomonas sp. BGYR3]